MKNIFIIMTFILVSCSSQKELIVESKIPEVTVSILNKSGSNFEQVGKTPYKVNSDKLKQLDDAEFLTVKLSKQGYVTENFLISTEGRDKLKLISNLQNVPDWTEPASENSSLVANSIMTETQQINYLIKKAKYSEALNLVDQLITKYPKAPILYDLQGSILLLKGDKGRSIASYEKSLILNPVNEKTKTVLGKLKKDK